MEALLDHLIGTYVDRSRRQDHFHFEKEIPESVNGNGNVKVWLLVVVAMFQHYD